MVCLNCGWKRPKASSSRDIAAEPHHDSQRDYHKHSGILFVRNSGETSSNHFIQQKFSQEEGTKFWSGDEDETDGDDSNNYNSWNRFAGKFPILGGKSAISQDPLLRERWKGEMSKDRGISSERLKENASEMDYSSPTAPGFCGSGEDKDIAGWFRRKSGN